MVTTRHLLTFFVGLYSVALMTAMSGFAQQRPPVELKDHGRRVHLNGLLFDGHNDLPW